MALFVSLLALDGSAVLVNPESVSTLTPVPTALLPVGVLAGTFLDDFGDPNSRFSVQGTPAATAAALGIGSAAVLPAVFFDSTGFMVGARDGVLSVVRNAAGDYTVTLAAPGYPINTLALIASSMQAAGLIVNAEQPTPTTIHVTTWDGTGAPTDASVGLVAIPGLSF